jgi:hypothetical protein
VDNVVRHKIFEQLCDDADEHGCYVNLIVIERFDVKKKTGPRFAIEVMSPVKIKKTKGKSALTKRLGYAEQHRRDSPTLDRMSKALLVELEKRGVFGDPA